MRFKPLNTVTIFPKILNSLVQSKKKPGQNHFLQVEFIFTYVIYEPNFQILVALFTTFRMQKEDNIIFVCGCFRTI